MGREEGGGREGGEGRKEGGRKRKRWGRGWEIEGKG